MSTISSVTASSVRSEAQSVPPAILSMPLPKVQAALAKSLKNLKQRDQIINTLKKQLQASSYSSSQLPTSSPPRSIALEQATLRAQNELESANERAISAEERIKDLEKGVKDLVDTSKEMQDQQVTSMKAAVAQAMTEKEDTFEHLGEARERNAELQDALREANAQLRMLQVERAALHEQLDLGPTSADEEAVSEGQPGSEGISGKVGDMKQQLAAALDELQTLKNTLAERHNDGHERLQGDMQRLQEQFEAERATREAEAADHRAALEQLKAEHAEAAKELEVAVSAAQAELEAVHAQSVTDEKAHTDELATAARQLEEEQAARAEAAEALAAARAAAAAAVEQQAVMEAEMAAVRQELEELRQEGQAQRAADAVRAAGLGGDGAGTGDAVDTQAPEGPEGQTDDVHGAGAAGEKAGAEAAAAAAAAAMLRQEELEAELRVVRESLTAATAAAPANGAGGASGSSKKGGRGKGSGVKKEAEAMQRGLAAAKAEAAGWEEEVRKVRDASRQRCAELEARTAEVKGEMEGVWKLATERLQEMQTLETQVEEMKRALSEAQSAAAEAEGASARLTAEKEALQSRTCGAQAAEMRTAEEAESGRGAHEGEETNAHSMAPERQVAGLPEAEGCGAEGCGVEGDSPARAESSGSSPEVAGVVGGGGAAEVAEGDKEVERLRGMVTRLEGELERLQATEGQSSEELAWKIQELSAERQRAAEAERALHEGHEAARTQAEHLQAELAAAREQLLCGLADEELAAHLREFTALRDMLLETMDDQEAELQALRAQCSVLENQEGGAALKTMRGQMTAIREALGRPARSTSLQHDHSAPAAVPIPPGDDAPVDGINGRQDSGADAVIREVAELTQRLGGAVERAMAAEAERDAAAAEVAQACAQRTEAEARVAQLEREASELREELQGSTEAAAAARRDVEESAAECAAASAQAAEARCAAEEAAQQAEGRAAGAAEAQRDAEAQAAEEVRKAAEAAERATEAESRAVGAEQSAEEALEAVRMAQQTRDEAVKERDAALRQVEEAEMQMRAEVGAAADVASRQVADLRSALVAAEAQRDEAVAAVAAKRIEHGAAGVAAEGLQGDLEAAVAARDASVEARAAAEGVAEKLRKDVEDATAERDAARKAGEEAAGVAEAEVRRRATAALKKTKALHEAQIAELKKDLEGALAARHEAALSAEERVESERKRAAEAEAVAVARLQAVQDAEAAAAAKCAEAEERVGEAKAAAEGAVARAAEAVAAKETSEAAQAVAEKARAEAEVGKEAGVRDAAAREARLKKAIGDLKHKVDAAMAEAARGDTAAAETRLRVETLLAERATFEARAQMLEREVERQQVEAREYRGRAQALLAAKDKEVAAARDAAAAGGGSAEPGVAEALGMLSSMRVELAAKEDDAAATTAAAHEAELAAQARADAAAEELEQLQSALEDALQRAETAEAARQRSVAAEARLAARSAAAAAAPAAPAAATAAELRARLAATESDLRSTRTEFAAFKEMSAQLADSREEALAAALEQVAELRAHLDDARPAEIMSPMTPSQRDPALQPGGHSGPGASPADHLVEGDSFGPPSKRRTGSFDFGEMLAGQPAEPPASDAIVLARVQDLEERLHVAQAHSAELQAENEEMAADAARAEAQLSVLKDELREVERASRRKEVSENEQVMEFLKANVVSLYCTGDAQRLLYPLGQLLSLSDSEKAKCSEGLKKWHPTEASTVTAATEYLGSWFGMGQGS